jgi:hypothetical protein
MALNQQLLKSAYGSLAKENASSINGTFPSTQAEWDAADIYKTGITFEDVVRKYVYYDRLNKMVELRNCRDVMLQAQDWRIIKSITTGVPLSDEWKQWFEDMRNITDTAMTIEEAVFPIQPGIDTELADSAEPWELAKMTADFDVSDLIE